MLLEEQHGHITGICAIHKMEAWGNVSDYPDQSFIHAIPLIINAVVQCLFCSYIALIMLLTEGLTEAICPYYDHRLQEKRNNEDNS